jgi:hypothetical protein
MIPTEPTMRVTTVTASGVVLPHPAVIYHLRLAASVSQNQTVVAVLYDSSSGTDGGIMAMTALNGAPDDWPSTPMRFRVEHGLYADFATTGSALLSVWWNAQ